MINTELSGPHSGLSTGDRYRSAISVSLSLRKFHSTPQSALERDGALLGGINVLFNTALHFF
jgi:hypothetical protein